LPLSRIPVANVQHRPHSRAHGLDAASRQAARRYRRQPDDRACRPQRARKRDCARGGGDRSTEIAEAVRAAGFEAVMTSADHESGSDRIFEALGPLDPQGRVETVVNLQGDLPTVEPETVGGAVRRTLEARPTSHGGRRDHRRG
jgi:hypothetical protein